MNYIIFQQGHVQFQSKIEFPMDNKSFYCQLVFKREVNFSKVKNISYWINKSFSSNDSLYSFSQTVWQWRDKGLIFFFNELSLNIMRKSIKHSRITFEQSKRIERERQRENKKGILYAIVDIRFFSLDTIS